PCAHLCRYCSIDAKGVSGLARISFERFYALVDRFELWGRDHGFRVEQIVHASDDITDEVEQFLAQVIPRAQAKSGDQGIAEVTRVRAGTVRTGGVRMRSDSEIRVWLARWREAGSTEVHGSFCGTGTVHDWWNNREGDYGFLLRIQH